MIKSGLLLVFTLLIAGCGDTATPSNEALRPNIVLILADDMGYGDLGSYNPDSQIPTPNMDRLAREGIRFTDAHSPSAVCTPTRYALLTGRYSWRSRLKSGVLWGYDPNLIETDRLTIAGLLQQEGYATAGIGKWHLGLGTADSVDYSQPFNPGPNDHGFDYYFGIPSSLDMEPYLFMENDRAVVPPTDHIDASRDCCIGDFFRGGPVAPGFKHIDVLPRITEEAVAYIEGRKEREGQPFFLYVPLAAPHTPWLPTEAFTGKSGAGEYGDFTMQVDQTVGRIVEALEATGQLENTLLVLTSDNGAYWTPDLIEQFNHKANLDHRGMKADIWEGGHRIPFIARWPGKIQPGTSSTQVMTHTDLVATFAAAASVSLPDDVGEDSYNMLPAMMGEAGDESIREGTIHHSSMGVFALRQGPWKLIEGLGSGGFTEPKTMDAAPGEPTGQLYNLEDDPGETTNLYLERPDMVAQLQGLLNQYRDNGRSRP